MLSGAIPNGNGDPETAVSAPLLASIENTERLVDPALPTYRNVPAASIVSTIGADPVAEPGVTSVRVPVLEIVNSDTLLAPAFAAYRNFPDG